MYTWMGISTESISSMWQTPAQQPDDETNDPHATKAPHEMIEEYHKRQLLSVDNLESLSRDHLLAELQRTLTWSQMGLHPSCTHKTAESITFSLWAWCNHLFIEGFTKAYYGEQILALNPRLLAANQIWERTSWKYIFKLPRLLAGDMFSAKDEIVETFRRYFELPPSERADANYFVGAVEDELRACELSHAEIARVNMLHHWA